MPELNGVLVRDQELEFSEAVERVEAELRSLELPRPAEARSRRRITSGLGIAAAAAILAGSLTAVGHLPPF